jgi:hypothetical protein
MSSFPPKCYYCNQNDFGSVDGYERHLVTHHPDLPGYPGPADCALWSGKAGYVLEARNKNKHGMEIAVMTQSDIRKSEDKEKLVIDFTDDDNEWIERIGKTAYEILLVIQQYNRIKLNDYRFCQ